MRLLVHSFNVLSQNPLHISLTQKTCKMHCVNLLQCSDVTDSRSVLSTLLIVSNQRFNVSSYFQIVFDKVDFLPGNPIVSS